jgi:beta-N-acetylhexosaminidase
MRDVREVGYAADVGAADVGAADVGAADLRRLALAVVQPGFTGLTAPAWLLERLAEGLGGVALFARNIQSPAQVAALTAAIHTANPAALVAIDEEGGDVTRLEHSTGSSWPGNLALGAVDDTELTQDVAAEIGAALAELGIDLDYAPDADVNVEAANPVIGVRSFGTDPELVARHTAAWVTGLQSAGVLACAKHFPGHGDTGVDSHHDLPEVVLGDPATSPWLVPFRAAVAAGAASVMSAHVRVPEIDARPATLVPAIMTDLLRRDLGFTGLTLSDGLEMGAVAGPLGVAEGAVQAVLAGVDALCIGGGLADADTVDTVVEALVEAVESGRLPLPRLVEAAGRVVAAARLRDQLRTTAVATRAGRAVPGASPAGRVAAARALRVRGSIPLLLGADVGPCVLELVGPSNIAVGDDTPSGITTAVARRWPGTEPLRITDAAGVRAGLAGAAERAVWVVVRDPHRHQWMDALVEEIVRERADSVVIDTGWPGWSPPPRATHLVTYGASWASGEAVVDLLAP